MSHCIMYGRCDEKTGGVSAAPRSRPYTGTYLDRGADSAAAPATRDPLKMHHTLASEVVLYISKALGILKAVPFSRHLVPTLVGNGARIRRHKHRKRRLRRIWGGQTR